VVASQARFQGLFDVFCCLVFSSYKGYLNSMQVMKLRVLSKPHKHGHVLFDQQIGQLSSDDFVSMLLPRHLGVAPSFVGQDEGVARRGLRWATLSVFQTLNPPYERWVDEFPALQAGVLAAAEAQDARLVSMENVYMYGRPAGRPLTETRDYAAHTKKGKLRGQMATELLAAHGGGRLVRMRSDDDLVDQQFGERAPVLCREVLQRRDVSGSSGRASRRTTRSRPDRPAGAYGACQSSHLACLGHPGVRRTDHGWRDR
jgi:hypothetical protein